MSNKQMTPSEKVKDIKTDGIIEKNELEQIRTVRQTYSDVIIALGQLSINKRTIQDNIADLNKQYNDITEQYNNDLSILNSQISDIDTECEKQQSLYNDTVTQDEQISHDLQAKYGNIEIVNFETGEYKRVIDETDNESKE